VSNHGLIGWPLLALLLAVLVYLARKALLGWPDYSPRQRWAYRGVASVLLALIATALPYAVAGTPPWDSFLGKTAAVFWVIGWSFIGLLALARAALNLRWGPCAVARTVLSEVMAMKVAMFMICCVLFGLAALAFFQAEGEQPLRYRVQQFLTYGLNGSFIFLCVMTVFVSCWTLSSEMRDKQVFTVMVKPISRTGYIFGKWLGVSILNAMLLLVIGSAIYGFTVFYLAELPGTDRYDKGALLNEVLVSRVSIPPAEPEDLDQRVAEAFERLQRDNPEQIARMGGEKRAIETLKHRYRLYLRTIGRFDTRQFVFEGLGDASRYSDFVQLRYKIKLTQPVKDDIIPVLLSFNGRAVPEKWVAAKAHAYPLPVELIDKETGRLTLAIRNINYENPNATYQRTIIIPPDGLEILYRVGDFGPNLMRGMVTMWVRLLFLGMLGLATATFLSFPVAVLFSLMILFAAFSSAFLMDSLATFTAKSEGLVWLLKLAAHTIAWTVSTALQKFGEFSPTPLVVDGRLFSWQQVWGSILWIGVLWTGAAAVVAYVIYQRRELAKVQV